MADAKAKIVIEAENRTKGEIEKVQRDLDALKESGRGVSRGLALGAGAATFGALAVGLRQVISAADEFSRVNSQIRLVTQSSQEAASVQQQLFQIAQQTRQGFSDLAQTYTAVARSAGELGLSQQQLLNLSTTISQAVQISGGTAESTRAALVQLGQGLSSGTLRGEELNSVLEQTPRLARALADGLGVPLGQLRKLGEEGRLTAQAVVEALGRVAPQIEKEFQTLAPTVATSFTVLSNSAKNFLARLDEILGLSRAVGASLRATASALDTVTAGASKQRLETAELSGTRSQLAIAQARRSALPDDSPAARRLDAQIAQYQQRIDQFRRTAAETEQRFASLPAKAAVGVGAAAQKIIDKYEGNASKFAADVAALNDEYAKGNISLERYSKLLDKVKADFSKGLGGDKSSAGRGRQTDLVGEALESLARQNAQLLAQTETEKALFEVQRGRYKALDEASKKRILAAAAEIDATRKAMREEENNRREAEQERDLWDTGSEALGRYNTELFKYYRSLEETIDPGVKVRSEIERLNEAVKRFGENDFTRFRKLQLELEDAASVGPAVPEGTRKEIEETDKAMKSLGLTFTSAFEEAALSGKSFSEVLKGLQRDILRIVLRRTVTEPLGNALSSAIGDVLNPGNNKRNSGSNNILSSLFSFGASLLPGGRPSGWVSGSDLPAGKNAGVTVMNYYTIDSRTDRAQIVEIVQRGGEATKADIQRSISAGESRFMSV